MSGRPHRRRRTEVACSECRYRKLKCEGTRPVCARCQHRRRECRYQQPIESGIRRPKAKRDQQDLARRVELLEDKVGHGTGSQTHSPSLLLGKTVSEDTSVDELATHAFSETSLGHVYFGSSSNYAIFRHISNAFAESALLHLTLSSHGSPAIQSCSITEGKQKSTRKEPSLVKQFSIPLEDIHALPSRDEALHLISRFSTTIGAILQYVNYETLLDTYEKALLERPPKFQRGFLALLNMVWAHASASLQLPEAEVFYSHCAGLLDQRTLERPTFELVQTLLLKSLYEQNHQRSTLSYTTHANCVRASLQMGFHCASVRDAQGHTSDSLYRKLWLGVLNNDRVMGLTQGRPLLIPYAIGKTCKIKQPAIPGDIGSLYLFQMTSSNSILHDIIATLYDQNLDSGQSLNMQTAINKRDNLHFQLEQWADSLPKSISLLPSGRLIDQSAVPDSRWAVRLLLCIQYHRLELTTNFPLMMRILEPDSMNSLGKRTRENIQRSFSQILKDDWFAVREVQRLISHISTLQGCIDMYASWYTCNYTIFTALLHCLALFLLRQQYPLDSEPTPPQIRQEIEACLHTMRIISRGSIVNQKADYCIQSLLVVFDALVNNPHENTSNPLDTLTTEFIFQHIKLPTEEFLNQCSRHEESEQAQLFLDIFSSIPLCE
ncbi:uncharacterized protein BO88DRAFT_483346 [Aspergillus vadensis CBS 113365]|uniref:Zn(2)-C6 fungal-type domain-containing protein n=1 Tax=Aspergillus vadensis (strain CBS 113365 / IMI 142717 / IBT 24658) TaxID=1448311 RepID=A0A319BRX4_ASPVC|nr:hypothetical protein BO88DRAFT_483346 [Aspergillus vadensis CBS 113365]PYH74259.1 hypothetical protein BO88DRAFT_483346 [Aspergillus vadensis CBS 113365]